MKTLTTNTMFAAAALIVAAGAASAQTTMKAEIPFAFRAAGVLMGPGQYRVSYLPSGPVATIRLFSVDQKNAILLLPRSPHDPSKAQQAKNTPVLVFECGASRCELDEAWTGDSRPAYSFVRPKSKDGETRTAFVTLQATKSE